MTANRDAEWAEQKKWRDARDRLRRANRGRLKRRAEPPAPADEPPDTLWSEIAPGK